MTRTLKFGFMTSRLATSGDASENRAQDGDGPSR
jgi:hypothetical protein